MKKINLLMKETEIEPISVETITEKKARLKNISLACMATFTRLETNWNPDGMNSHYRYQDLYDFLMTSYEPKIRELQSQITWLEGVKKLVDQGQVE